ncbi:uncharacterized protein CcaverHIS019_0701880 [Cutaneotrichosporon cavernicola]|uniref:DNA replication ATP-dependent helicase/nuclease n=1 Tax=Cutaneotrichosporon cavernicola TaxID=279322 RepID=A0AA48LA15_9TREE|nr:uncharacterized protein CcaverHIS019_0701880 [Cutaneotrichosporon cavernicola]BEI94616.1 hypothetical protein CcaverHIS019_0701880 [Cutaneotrichosporon cavernicola]BEJ02393.1 hypothetical protein CcaverHIS631_0701880 [Cutaneotrichosporon cavernicola]BEJ10151.1 hypothetical protein CcaverHIS641_0701860 [Cutaneotrichosporon cavernicola]
MVLAERSAKRQRLNSAAEDTFMAELLAGIDASAFDDPPSQPSPKKTPLRPVNLTPRSSQATPLKSTRPQVTLVKRPAPLSPVKSPAKSPIKSPGKHSKLFAPKTRSTPYFRPPTSPAKPDASRPPLATLRPNALSSPSTALRPKYNGVKAEPAWLPSLSPSCKVPHSTSLVVEAPTSPRVLPDLLEAIQGSNDDYDGDWDLDALASLDDSMFKEPIKYPIANPDVPALPAGYAPTPWVRCTVESVHAGILDDMPEDEFDEGEGYGKTLVVGTPSGRRLVQLTERWADLRLRLGDIVNVISPHLAGNGPIAITFKDTSSYLVAHPDILVTMTSIANAMPCTRRPLLNQLVRLPEPVSKPIVYGTILHGLLQESLREGTFDPAATRRRVTTDLATDGRRLEVWGAGLDPGSVAEDLGRRAEDAFASFGRRWVGASPKAEGNVVTARDESVGTVAINGLHDVEEDIWSPKWGLKGKVDASVQAIFERDGQSQEVVAPMEIKTGRSIGGVQHRAQTLLYTLLMEDRYGLPVPAGLLYYSQRDLIVLVEARANEVRALVQTRNELAEWMVRGRQSADEPFLPRTVDNQRECKNCFASEVCMLYRRANDKVPPIEDDPIGDIYEDKTAHLTDEHAEFFRHWERLLTLEEQDTVRLRAQLWTMGAHVRQAKGRCFADMVIAKEENEGSALSKINHWAYTFRRVDPQAGSLLSGHIARSDPVCLSLEPDLLYLARGFVTSLSAESVTITVQNKLDVQTKLKRVRSTAAPIFRIDKDELSSGMTRMRGNLAQLFVKEGDSRRRSLVVDLGTPRFDSTRAPKPHEIPPHLNEDQRGAMAKVLTAKDYALVLGMPGTGKTTTVAEIIRAIVARGQSVLLTSYTHSAVDTIVSKLIGADFGVLRLGNVEKVHPAVRHLTLEALGPAATLDEFEARLMSPPVVAATCLSIEHPVFKRRRFDYCIVDEASQITLPTCLGPLRCADAFVLVGDHFQLPPIVRKPEARAGGLDISLFRRLSDAHPAAVAPLAAQYRMNADIMTVSNALIYEERLRCGSDAVANQSLVLSDQQSCESLGGTCDSTCWVQDLMREERKAVFVDTDTLPAKETRAGDLVQNPTEAALIATLAHALVASGTSPSDIAVITPYRQQIKLIQRVLHTIPKANPNSNPNPSLNSVSLTDIEVLTADKSQGRDKAVILVSLVRSNDTGSIGELLRDWRRINVSFTRAKAKLVVFGSSSTLAGDRLMADFLKLMDSRGWMLRLPPSASLHGGEVPDETTDKERRSVLGGRMLEKRPFITELLAGE